MYLEKARNVSDLSYRVQVSATQVLIRPILLDCTALLAFIMSLSSHHLPCWSGFWCVSRSALWSVPLTLQPQIKQTHGLQEQVKH